MAGAPEGNQNAVGNEGGRPSEYNNNFLTYAKRYLLEYDQKPNDEVIPTMGGLALFTGVHRNTLYGWLKDPEKIEFLGIYEQLMAKQEKELVNKGLIGKFESPITKVMLVKHGYIDKTETDTTHKFDNEPSEKDKAKLDAILHGTKPATTQQSGPAGDDSGQSSRKTVPSK